MSIQISIDKNVINMFRAQLIEAKFLPALQENKIIMHLTDSFLQELLIDGSQSRRARHSNTVLQVFNGKIILPMTAAFKAELNGRREIFVNQSAESAIRQLLDDMAQGKQLTSFWESKRQALLKSKRPYDEDLKIGQEMNLKNVFRGIKNVIVSGLFRRQQFEEFDFEQYYNAWPNDQKLKKLQKQLEVNGIAYGEGISSCLDSQNYPFMNSWLRSWYAYHYYTVQRWQPTLRRNDASDLIYIVSAHCLDHLITNDKMLRIVGNLTYNSTDKFITWDNFELKYLT